MSYEFIAIDRHDHIAILRLNRPENLNSWNVRMRQDLRDAIQTMVEDDDLRVLILTGTGRAFSAGEDVRGMGDSSAIGSKAFRRRVRLIHNVFDEIEQMEIPVIAALNGVAAGGGLELALSCDFRFAADDARLGLPEGNVGLIPGSGGISRLVRLIGPSKAKRLIMTGEIITAERALNLGLVDEIHPTGELLEACLNFAELLAARAPLALGTAKLVINQCANVDMETGRNFERIGQSVLKLSQDHREGTRAFIEKRSPVFKGL